MAIATGTVNGLGLVTIVLLPSLRADLPGSSGWRCAWGSRAETLSGLGHWRFDAHVFWQPFSKSSRRPRAWESRQLDDITGDMREVAEGIKTSRAAHDLAARLG
jgi:hypothetical protein